MKTFEPNRIVTDEDIQTEGNNSNGLLSFFSKVFTVEDNLFLDEETNEEVFLPNFREITMENESDFPIQLPGRHSRHD